MENFLKIKKTVIAAIHVEALPGTPRHNGDIRQIIEKARNEALIYKKAGVNTVIIENMHDVPYLRKRVGPEVVAAMAVIGNEIKSAVDLRCGVQILAGANNEALAVAKASGLDFVRVEGFVFAHVADEGIIESCAGELLRYRKMIGADEVKVFTDIKKKHSSHAITDDVDIAETAKAAEFFLSDGVVVTGVATGTSANLDEVKQVRKTVDIPVLIGSGLNDVNLESYFPWTDGFIVGSYFKKDGLWSNALDERRIRAFMDRFNSLESQ
ncbi:MAG: BtpA/SgcQ family protein [Candidatus Xenobiia bacterium LiM19]